MKSSAMILGIIMLINLIVFIMYLIDKAKAIKDKWRISEKTLLIASLLGAWVGFWR